VVMGPTGSGKTNFIHSLGTSGDSGSATLKPGTQGVVPHVVEYDGQNLVFVDTPGLDNINMPDETIFSLVAKWLEVNCQSDIDLGIIFLHRITDNRIQGSPQRHIDRFRRQCTGAVVHQICVVTTMWDEVDDMGEAEIREEHLKDEFRKGGVHMLFKRFDNQRSSTQDITSSLVGGEARRLLEELREREKRPIELDSRSASYMQLQQLLSKRRDVLQQLLGDAASEGNQTRMQELRAELDTLNTRIGLTFEEMRERHTSLMSLVVQWLSRIVGITYDA